MALDAERRIGELARMLGGRKITAATRKNAAEMIQAAGREA
jgi:DNA repair ATPase RecN